MKPGQDYVPSAQQDPTQPRPDVIRLDKVEPSVVRWLWESRIALGKLTLIAGDPGLGKSFLTLDLCARVSTGAAFPGERYADGRPMDRLPGVAILLSAEDDPADTIRPRLEAAGADLQRVALVRGVKTVGPDRAFNLRTDIGYLRGMCKAEPETKLIVIDPRRIDMVKSAHIEAAHHLPLTPGTNVAVVTALGHVIVTEGLYDEAFIRERCANSFHLGRAHEQIIAQMG